MDYFFRDSRGHGKATLADVESAVANGILTSDVLVSSDGKNWIDPATAKIPPARKVRQAKPEKNGRFGFWIFAVAALCFLFWLTGQKQKADAIDHPEMTAYFAGQSIIKRYLNDPKSAEFDNPYSEGNEAFYSIRGDGLAEVGGKVRAKNAFGGTVTNDWRCLLKAEGNGWKAVYVKLGDKKTGDYLSHP